MIHAAQIHGTRLAWVLTGGVCLAAGCTSPEDERTAMRVAVYGEDFIEQAIPADEVSDGWSIEFDRFLIAIGNIEAGGETIDGTFVFDLARPSGGQGHPIDELLVPTGSPVELTYRVGRSPDAVSGNVDADLAGASMLVEGSATRGNERKTFAWAINTDTTYVDCVTGPPDALLTIHADHLFYDDLDLPEPNVAFDLIASADTNGDDVVDAAELAATDISSLNAYQVGSRDIDDLWGFIAAQSTTVGHIDGEGHCERLD